jgi:hypothetical protein
MRLRPGYGVSVGRRGEQGHSTVNSEDPGFLPQVIAVQWVVRHDAETAGKRTSLALTTVTPLLEMQFAHAQLWC